MESRGGEWRRVSTSATECCIFGSSPFLSLSFYHGFIRFETFVLLFFAINPDVANTTDSIILNITYVYLHVTVQSRLLQLFQPRGKKIISFSFLAESMKDNER